MAAPAATPTTLDREFLEIRARILELAAALDRLERAGDGAADDPRMITIRAGLEVLESHEHGRAEQVQLIFSLPYDDRWRTTLGVLAR